MKKIVFAAGFALAFSASFFGQTFGVLKDLRPEFEEKPRFAGLAELGGRAFFVAYTIDGIGLFRAEGEQPPQLVKTLRYGCDGPDAADIGGLDRTRLASDGERLFIFLANAGFTEGYEIWVSDGTESGTQPVCVFPKGIAFFQKGPAFLGQKLIFRSSANGFSLAAFDGSAAGPQRILPADATADFSNYETQFDGRLIFLAYKDFEGQELWATSGDSASTVFLPAASGQDGIFAMTAEGEVGGKKLFLPLLSGGTLALFALAAGSSQLEKLAQFGAPSKLALPQKMPIWNGKALFRAVDSTGKQAIWQTDGTAAGTSVLFECDPENMAAFSPDPIFVFKNRLFCFGKMPGQWPGLLVFDGAGPAQTVTTRTVNRFFEQDSILFGWVGLDGNEPLAIIRLFADQPAPATAWSAAAFSSPMLGGDFFDWKGRESFFLRYVNNSAGQWEQRWLAFDGVGETDLALVDAGETAKNAFVERLFLPDGRLFAIAREQQFQKILRSDGSPSGTAALDFLDRKSRWSSHSFLPSDGSRAFFFGDRFSPAQGQFIAQSLWQTDGTTAGTTPIDLPDGVFGDGSGLEAGGFFWFFVPTVSSKIELWRTNGTTTEKLFSNFLNFGLPPKLHGWDGQRLWLTANQTELWCSTGLPMGMTRIAEDVHPGLPVRAADGRAFFVKATAAAGYEHWTSDGTTAGTKMLLDAMPGPQDGTFSPAHPGPSPGQNSFFMALEPPNGDVYALWRTDGSAVEKILAWPPPHRWGDFRFVGNLGAKTIFSAIILYDSLTVYRHELWATDGFLNEKLADDLPIGAVQTGPPFGGKIAFTSSANGFSNQLWTTDGTPEGTKNSHPNPCSQIAGGFSILENLTESGGELWFLAQNCDEPWANSIWRSDGTEAGTRPMLTDSCKGLSGPTQLTRFGPNRLLFSADSRLFGNEPWILETETVSTDEPIFPENEVKKNTSRNGVRDRFFAAPNPTDGPVFLKNEKRLGDLVFEKVWLTDALGRVVLERKSHRSSQPIWLGELPDGAYFLFQKMEKRPAEAVGAVLKKG